MPDLLTELKGQKVASVTKVPKGTESQPAWDLLFFGEKGNLLDSFHYMNEAAANEYAAQFGVTYWDDDGVGKPGVDAPAKKKGAR